MTNVNTPISSTLSNTIAGSGNGSDADLSDTLAKLVVQAPDDAALQEARACYGAHQELMVAVLGASEKMLATPEGAARFTALEQCLRDDQSGIDGHRLVQELAASVDFSTALSMAGATGLKAIGIGIAGSFSLVVPGVEKGIEGLLLLPQNYAPGMTHPYQVTSRSWRFVTVGVDVLASAGIQITLWYTQPTTEAITGVVVDLTVGVGLRFCYIKGKAIPNAKPTRPIAKPNATFAGLSLRPSIGLQVGGGVFAGIQNVPADSKILPTPPADPTDVMTLFVFNAATQVNVVEIGQTSALQVTLTTPPSVPSAPMLTPNVSTLSLTMPTYYTSDNISAMVVIPPADWTVESATATALNLTYTGSQSTVWSNSLVFSINGAFSGSSEEAVGDVIATVNGVSTKATTARASLQLVAQTFQGSITDWTLKLAQGFAMSDDAPTAFAGSLGWTAPPTGYVALTYTDSSGSLAPTMFTYTDGDKTTTWQIGYYLEEDASGDTTTIKMQAVIWQDGTSWSKGTKYLSNKTALTSTVQTMQVYFDDDEASTVFAITAQLS